MTLNDVRGAYETLSGKASDIVRQISLAGIGLIWVFRSGSAKDSLTFSLDPQLLKAAVFIALALVLDFLQYLLGTTIWFIYFRYKEKQNPQQAFTAPPQLNWPAWTLFYVKSLFMLVAYGCYIVPFLAAKAGI